MKTLSLFISLFLSFNLFAADFCEELFIAAQKTAGEGHLQRRLAGRSYLNAKHLLESERDELGQRRKQDAKVKIVQAKAYLETSMNLFNKLELECEEQRDEAIQFKEILKVSLNQTNKLEELILNL